MGRANVQVVSTRAGLHSLAHRYGRTISVFTKVSSSDRIILNQYSIRGDALWYALPALPRTDANPHSDSFTGCDRKDSWLRRSAFPISSTLTCGPRIQRCYRTILKPAVKMVQATSARFGPLLVKTLRPPGTRNSRLESSARPRLVYIRGHTVTGISSLPLRPWNPEPALEFPTPPKRWQRADTRRRKRPVAVRIR